MIEQLPEVQSLTESEKLQLVAELWDQLAKSAELASNLAIVRLVERGSADFEAGRHTHPVGSWEETARSMAEANEDWSEWDSVIADGLHGS